MSLSGFIKFGYALVVVTMLLMIWVSLTGAREYNGVSYPPCYFNPLCTCSKAMPNFGIVQCQNIPMPRLPSELNTSSSKLFMLHLNNNGLRHFEPYFLQGTGLYRLAVTNNPLREIPDEAFMGLERSLWELQLSYDQLIEVPTRALRHLQKLRHLDLTGNEISEIEPESWRGLENSLQVLILAENFISSLPTDSFSGLPLLDTIDLHGNNLRTIDPSVFRDGMGRLTRILLGDNQLSIIPYVALSPLKTLRVLDLSKNEIDHIHPGETDSSIPTLSLDVLHLDENQITDITSGSFQYFDVINSTFLDGNPLRSLEENAFREARIRELFIRDCGLTEVSPSAFEGLESSLQILDLSGNNITGLTPQVFHTFDLLHSLSLRNNLIQIFKPDEMFNGLQSTLLKLDLSGRENAPISLQDLRRMRSLRSLSVSHLLQSELGPEDFINFGIDLEELRIIRSNIKKIKNHAFMHVRGLRSLDLSENLISTLDTNAFEQIGHGLGSLRIAHGLSASIQSMPTDTFRHLINLNSLDLSNNYIRAMSDTCFHFLTKLKRINLQDNNIDQVYKGTFQGDLHSNLEEIFLSFNDIHTIVQHTFADLASLEQLHLDDNIIDSIERRAFINLHKLKRLNLRGNKIKTISDEAFQNLPELDTLDLSYNQLKDFDFQYFDQVGILANFKVNISHNKIYELRVNISGIGIGRDGHSYIPGTALFSNIKVFDLSFNNISYISKSFFSPTYTSLTHLYLSHNSLNNVTRDVFGSMQQLRWLDISWNNLDDIDFNAFRNTKKLQVLLVSHNNIDTVPSGTFQALTDLRVVDFSYNDIKYLPDHLFPEEGLERLDLSHNELNRIPLSCLSTAAAASLCEMDVSHNLISSLAYGDIFGRFQSLMWLDLSYNMLIKLDEAAFVALPRLNFLDLSHNKNLDLENEGLSFKGLENTLIYLGMNNISLTSVPELPFFRLRSLSIADNDLPTIPPEMAANMTSLRHLDLTNNDLTAVPVVLQSLRELRSLSLAGNPITSLTNNSFIGISEKLQELDIRKLALNNFELGTLCKMGSLRSLHLGTSKTVRDFNIPRLLEHNNGLHHLHIQVDEDTNLAREMIGQLPNKVRNITLSGSGLKNLADNILEGVRSSDLNFAVRDSSLSSISRRIFQSARSVRNITIDLRHSKSLKSIDNPNTAGWPESRGKIFLSELYLQGNPWNCDCSIGWVEIWERKKRQYLCRPDSPNELECRRASDDLRIANCVNKSNTSLIEVLKSDLECGWGAADTSNPSLLILFFTIIITLNIL